ncbi:putative CyP450 monooxygenase [Auricularia subglabra TFB-10046 SS5]|nr:putative CyP450 monooxygenase [Auricularia subglabra TFB-10046 SS5]
MVWRLLVCSIVLYIGVNWLRRKISGLRSPPGPPGLPLLGNLFDVPSENSHLAFAELAKKYGPIMKLKVLHRTLIVVSGPKVISDLLEKRGAIYSDRPDFHMAMTAGFSWNPALKRHGDDWRIRRRLIHQKFYANATLSMHDLIRRTTVEFLRNMLNTPDNFRQHVRRSAAASIMQAVYGISIATENDPYVDIAVKAMEAQGKCLLPGTNLIDTIPPLRHVPPWVPILGYWTRRAHELRKYPRDMIEVPYARAKDDMRKGLAQPCMVVENLELMETEPEITEKVIKDACAVSYLGGADTTVGTLLGFIMAMVWWPELQRKAQEELDRVLGDRLPDFADQASLPYVEAIIRETYRRFPVLPLSIPHAVEEDDVYEGMFIPRGAEVLGNTWALMHDEKEYPEPMKFDPDRWLRDGKLDESVQDPRIAIYGFGRRICPGRHFADAAVFLEVAMALKCFRFGTYVDSNGVAFPPSGEIITGLVSTPAPFKCSIKPRSPDVEAMIDAAVRVYED